MQTIAQREGVARIKATYPRYPDESQDNLGTGKGIVIGLLISVVAFWIPLAIYLALR